MAKKASESKTLWFTYVLDIIALSFIVAEPSIHLLNNVVPAWVYLLTLVVVSVSVKVLRFVTYEEIATKRLGELIKRKTDLIDEDN